MSEIRILGRASNSIVGLVERPRFLKPYKFLSKGRFGIIRKKTTGIKRKPIPPSTPKRKINVALRKSTFLSILPLTESDEEEDELMEVVPPSPPYDSDAKDIFSENDDKTVGGAGLEPGPFDLDNPDEWLKSLLKDQFPRKSREHRKPKRMNNVSETSRTENQEKCANSIEEPEIITLD